MAVLEDSERFLLGLDLGSASLGWALVALDEHGSPSGLIRAGVRIFEPGVDGTAAEIAEGKDQSKAVDRRTARLHRRQLRRRAARQRDLFKLLQSRNLLPLTETGGGANPEQRHGLMNALDVELAKKYGSAGFGQLPLYCLRKRALDHPLERFELGRVLFHLSQRRGFLSNRKEVKKNSKEDEDPGKVKTDIESLWKEMAEAGARTLGEYLSGLDPHVGKVRRRWTARKMFQDEFAKIWEAQQPHHPEILTGDLRDKIAHLLFFQRPIAKNEHLIGKCELENGQRRAPWALMPAQRFRILQKVNDLRVIGQNGFDSKPLEAEQRRKLFDLLDREGDKTFAAIRAHLGLPKGAQFNLEKGDEKKLLGNRTQKSMLTVFGERWDTFPEGKQHQIIENWRLSESEDALREEARTYLGLDEVGAERLVTERPQPDYCALSLRAIDKLMPLMLEGKSFKEAETEIYGHRFSGDSVFETIPPVRLYLTSLRNPAVERALTELRKVVNAIVREYGKPYAIRIELARELKKPRQERVQATKANRKRQKEREDVAKRILQECGLPNPSRKDIEKALLHQECGGMCPYTGRSIAFSNLFHDSQFDVEHIIPASRYPDDSFQNKTLCYLPENREAKRNRTPFEVYGKDEERWAQILERVKCWQPPNPGKLKRFMLRDLEELKEFSARQMNDTRYTSVLAGKLLGTLYGGRDVVEDGKPRQVIYASSGAVTANLRRTWGLEAILRGAPSNSGAVEPGKARSDHRHHAIDAIVIALTGPAVVQAMSRAASAEPWQQDSRAWRKIAAPWADFVDSIRPHIEKMIVSHRPEHKLSGELHKGTNYGKPYLYEGRTTVHTRCALAGLSAKDIEAEDVIVDPAVRDAVRLKLAELGGKPKAFEKAENAPCLVAKDGRRIPIRKVRIRERRDALIAAGQGVKERFVASGGIHHVELFVVRDKKGREKWDGVMVQMPEAYERRRRRLPVVLRKHPNEPDAQFLFSLMKDDTIEAATDQGTDVLRIKKFYDSGQLWFVPNNDAHDDAKQKEYGLAWSKTPNSFKDLRPRKVTIDLLGRVHPAND
jgi:CRISPR-associated endonuclease Csn1